MSTLTAHDPETAADTGLKMELSADQRAARDAAREFANEHIVPAASTWDQQGEVPLAMVDTLRQHGYLGAPLPTELGGGGMDAVTYGLLTEEIGRGCASLRSLLTVHDMVSLAVVRWGTAEAKEDIAPRLARAERLGALALSEPGIGSDAAGVETVAREDGDGYVLDGRKKWTTFGEIADEFLVLARLGDKLTTFLVPADAPGFSREPLRHMVGTRAARLAELTFDGCRIGAERRVGRPGFGLSHVIGTALDHGRYSVAWGSVGIAQACLEASLDHANTRHQGGGPIAQHQLIQRRLADMIANTNAARLLCCRAGYLRQSRDPAAVSETMIAKYFASRAAVDAANSAVQLHGAQGLSTELPIERYLRDAKVAEIIEGSTEIQQISIPRYPLQEL